MNCSVLPVSYVSWRVWLLVVLLVGSSHACFIRNCPKGGKRSMEATRQCMACGPNGAGQCVGPSICCGPTIGCLMGTQEAEVCQKENESIIPCSVEGRQCGADNMGNCVADGICCVEDACSYNSLCDVSDQESDATKRQLLNIIRHLLVNRHYD